jgi:hypothetical protein
LYPKFEGHSDKLLDNLTSDALHASTDCSRSPLTELEPAPKDSETPVTERLESFFFLEIPETSVVVLEVMWYEEDDSGDDGNTPSHLC